MNAENRVDATVVLFGGTGDLSTRKLLPALFHLRENELAPNFEILAIGRRVGTEEEYHAFLREEVADAKRDPEAWAEFARRIRYHKGEIRTPEDFVALRKRLEESESKRGAPGNRLFYFAIGPRWFGPVTEQLAAGGLLERGAGSREPWTRLVIEKPFGHDLPTAQTLDEQLLAVADESQIYRIDHYLGKETVQNVLAFRFANGLFEPVWNHKYVSSVQITVAESLGVEDRGDYYDQTGALRDMVQNHMMQLLAFTAMEPPIGLDATSIRDEKAKVLRAIRLPERADEVAVSTVRGQYGPGRIDGRAVPGYREEDGVDPHSVTPTFVSARVFLDNWRWANVPFFLRHGKRMAKKGTEIAIQFLTPPLTLFRGTGAFEQCRNTLVLRIQPNEGIELHFGAKRPGAGMRLSNVRMDFEYQREFQRSIPDAYERLLLDAMLGDSTLFMRSDEVELMWQWNDAIVAGWDAGRPPDFPNYPAGSWGPPEAESLLPHGDEVPAGTCPIGWRRW